MHPALVQQLALERTASLYADAKAQRRARRALQRPRRRRIARAARRVLRPAHAQ